MRPLLPDADPSGDSIYFVILQIQLTCGSCHPRAAVEPGIGQRKPGEPVAEDSSL